MKGAVGKGRGCRKMYWGGVKCAKFFTFQRHGRKRGSQKAVAYGSCASSPVPDDLCHRKLNGIWFSIELSTQPQCVLGAQPRRYGNQWDKCSKKMKRHRNHPSIVAVYPILRRFVPPKAKRNLVQY